MNQRNRDYFDKQVKWVLARLPQKILHILRGVPLHVEDQPSKRLMRELEIADAEELCGYFSGLPFSGLPHTPPYFLSDSGQMPSNVTIFRRGIVAEARDEEGKLKRVSLRREIRITILHELAHLHGMNEDEITEIGYG